MLGPVIEPDKWQDQIATVVGVQELRGTGKDCLVVRSIHPKEEYNHGGSKYGYQYEWFVNHHSFTQNPSATIAAYGLTSDEYYLWEKQITY